MLASIASLEADRDTAVRGRREPNREEEHDGQNRSPGQVEHGQAPLRNHDVLTREQGLSRDWSLLCRSGKRAHRPLPSQRQQSIQAQGREAVACQCILEVERHLATKLIAEGRWMQPDDYSI
jgi:hypothetical protein